MIAHRNPILIDQDAAAAADPIFAAIAAYRAAWQAVEAASEAGAADSAGIAMSAAYRYLRTTRPTTPAGYAALADHLAWHVEREPEFGNTVGEHVAAMLIAGRGALHHVPLSAGSPGPDPVFAAFEAERPEPIAPCASAPLAAAETPTLSAMSIGELADLYDAGLLASQQLAALASMPASSGKDRLQLRILLDLEADRFGDLTIAVVDEMKSRLPATDEERADRVSILAKHAVRFHAWADLAGIAIAEVLASTGGHQ